MLTELAAWHAALPLESKVAAVIARHAPFAGRHHKDVRVGGRPLAETFTDPELDLAAFLAEFRESPQLRRTPDGLSRVRPGDQVRRADVRHLQRARGGGVRAVGRLRCRRGSGRTIEIVANTVGDERRGGAVGRDPGQPAGGRGDR